MFRNDGFVVVVVSAILVLGAVLGLAMRTNTGVRLGITFFRWLKADLSLTPPSKAIDGETTAPPEKTGLRRKT
jgi:hypothetical protein